MSSIVSVSISQRAAPIPNLLQQTGAIVSQGGTLTAPGTVSLITQPSDATPLYNGARAITSITWSSGVATVTTAAPHGFTLNEAEPVLVTIAGVTPAGYNGTFGVIATGALTFTYPLAANPGSMTVAGMYTLQDVAELVSQITTFFAQGNAQSVYVLELGEGDPADGVAALSAYMIANNGLPQPTAQGALPNRFYSYLVPREWDTEPTFQTLKASYQSLSAQQYFFVTTTLATYPQYTALDKCIVATVESPAYGVWPGNALTALTFSAAGGGIATATTTTAHGVAVGQWFQIAGAVPTAYNGYWQALPGTTGTTLVYDVTGSPASPATTNGSLVASYTANAGVAAGEFSAAALWRRSLAYRPSSTSRVAPFDFGFVYGVTAFPVRGNAALVTTLEASGVNRIDTGAEGGLANTIINPGTTMDNRDFTYWYAVDWVQINLKLALANAVINGSNTASGNGPLYYDQQGINTLLGVIAQTMNRGVTYGLVLGAATQTSLDGPDLAVALQAGTYPAQTVCNAVPFIQYSNENPSDYRLGVYNGFSVTFTPKRGFRSITIPVTVTDFVTNT